MNRLRWYYREATRLHRLLFPEASAKLLIKTIGPFWLFAHGAKREHKVSLWKGKGWYCLDLAIPHKKIGLEAKGGFQKYYVGDVARDQELMDHGWEILRVTEDEMNANPVGQRRRLRRYLKG